MASAVMIVLSPLLASTIAGPYGGSPTLPSASAAASRLGSRSPDFTRRRDETGYLSGTLRDMTNAPQSRTRRSRCSAADVLPTN